MEGRLDATTSPRLERMLAGSLGGVTDLVLDMKDVSYLSSAWLRVILYAQKAMAEHGGMSLRNVSDELRDIFLVTGFLDILTIR